MESLRLYAAAGMVKVGTVALDGTKLAANAADKANRTLDKLEAEVAEILCGTHYPDVGVMPRWWRLPLVGGVFGLAWSA